MSEQNILPIDEESVKIERPAEVATGAKAVGVSFKMGMEKMGVIKCLKTYNQLNQVNGFDCPSCAWPDPHPAERSSLAEYCENGAKAVADEATSARVDPAFFAKFSLADLMQFSERDLGNAGRITHPMIREEGADHYKPISWTNAFAKIGNQLRDLPDPNRAVFYTSGRTSNEAAFMYQLMVRMYGTNNLPDCSNMCHESSGVALNASIGIGKGTVKLEDFYIADLVIVVGQNPGTNHPRMMSALQKTKRNGGKIISVNPIPETGLKSFKNPQEVRGWIGTPTKIADLFLQVRINQDVALFKAIMHALWLEEEKLPGSVFDHDFIDNKTHGFQSFLDALQKQDFARLVESSGVLESDLQKAVSLIASAKKIIICWAMGITQHKNGVATIQELVNLLLLKGSIGIPGGGACPVRGHSNVQGDRTVGIWEHLKPAFKERLEDRFAFIAPSEDGYNVVQALEAMLDGRVDVFISMGGNLLLAGPDTQRIAQAMEKCKLTVMISTKLNRNHLVTGREALILPCLGRTERDHQVNGEQFVSVENSMGIVHKSQGGLEPASEYLMSEPQIVAGIAKVTLPTNVKVDWDAMVADYDRIRDHIEACIPGFKDYNKRVRSAGGFYLPNGPREQVFNTPSGKANFKVVETNYWESQKGAFLLTTIRSHDQFNTTIYDHNDRYRGVKQARRVLFMHAEDMKHHSLTPGDMVDIRSTYDNRDRWARRFAVIPYDIPQGCLAAYFPETNNLIPLDQYADGSFTPISKSVRVDLHPSPKT